MPLCVERAVRRVVINERRYGGMSKMVIKLKTNSIFVEPLFKIMRIPHSYRQNFNSPLILHTRFINTSFQIHLPVSSSVSYFSCRDLLNFLELICKIIVFHTNHRLLPTPPIPVSLNIITVVTLSWTASPHPCNFLQSIGTFLPCTYFY